MKIAFLSTNRDRAAADRADRANFKMTMKPHPLIFSNDPRIRLRRHLLFWFCWWLFLGFLYSFAAPASGIEYSKVLPLSLFESLLYLPAHIFLSYSLMYWVIPRFVLKETYVAAFVAVVAVVLAAAALSALISMQVIEPLRVGVCSRFFKVKLPQRPQASAFFLGMLAGLRGAITIGGMAAAIKLMKYWYLKEQRNMQLQKENMEAHLQLLKAQVHPHFLFNTLNNIYSFTQPNAPVASQLVLGLSDLLRYMLYECNQPLVPLEKEIKMLQDYVLLEEVRYNHQLDLRLQLPQPEPGLLVAPLLLLPFMENSFKHGASQVVEHPWISLSLEVEGRQLQLRLMNGKEPAAAASDHSGIGIENARKRLDLLYPGRHRLKITDTGDAFIVNLKIDLQAADGLRLVRKEHVYAGAG